MSAPNTYWITSLVKTAQSCATSHPTLGWTPARPLGLDGLFLGVRLKAAWLVFTGRADVVRWFDPKGHDHE